uniref:C-C motif chemokine n=1 Tax=Macaca mulatta TaxID=9544 RepID=A0A1D5QHN3_MACMU
IQIISSKLICMLLSNSWPQDVSSDALNVPSTCCFTFSSKKISLQRLKSYRITTSRCPQKAVIFRTKLGKEMCADPKEKWVQNFIKRVSHCL